MVTGITRTDCRSDTAPPSTFLTPKDVDTYGNTINREVTDANSESVEQTEAVSEIDNGQPEGSYIRYHGQQTTNEYQHVPEDVDDFETARTYEPPESTEQPSYQEEQPRHVASSPHHYQASPQQPGSPGPPTRNSFDRAAQEMAEDLNIFDEVTRIEEEDLRETAEKIPERNQDRLFSSNEPAERKISDGHSPAHHEENHHHRHWDINDQKGSGEEKHVYKESHEYEEHHEYEGDREREAHVHRHDAAPASSPNHYHPPTPGSEPGSTIGPPPSFAFRSNRLSRNVAEAMANIWDRFWADDVRQIVQIVKSRFSQIMPYLRRFLAHVVEFWGGIKYIKRALTAFFRVLNKDERVRELLDRVGWASVTTLRIFLSMCAMIMSATLQFYNLMRTRIIPDTRRVIPIVYYKLIVRLLQAAKRSPWSLYIGPFSLTFAIDEDKVPDKYFLHDKLSVPQEEVTFTSVQDFVESVRESVYRTRYGPQSSASMSTPVHTQSTDETPYPPPSGYVGPQYRGSKKWDYAGKENRESFGPLEERTNHEAELHVQHHHHHSQTCEC